MQRSFPEAMIPEEEVARLSDSMTNDPKDRHVLAAAVVARADILVTFNVKDFPEASVSPYRVRIETPDTFLSGLFQADPEQFAQVIQAQAARLRRPAKTTQQLLDTLRQHVPTLVERLQRYFTNDEVAKQKRE